jgi:3-methyladenine DNA glycosylase AlkC
METYITPFSNLTNPTGKHKDWYGPEFLSILCQEINHKDQHFKSSTLIKEFKKQYKDLELKQRLNLIVDLLDSSVHGSYKDKLRLLESLLGERLPFEEGMFTHCFFLYPVSQFIERHGHKDIEASLAFIEELTMRFTGEWAIRPLANIDQKRILKQMKVWAKHENFHVRRLASEGLRARLPWGLKIDWIDQHPELSLPIYNKLRNDKVLYVRRSVANSMGDLIKINEDLALETLYGWLDKKITQNNLWVIKHAIRTPVKKKDERFLELQQRVEALKP